jgi:hypothetical protein
LGQVWVAFKYERLPWICFHCGIVGHLERFCRAKLQGGAQGESSFKQYGQWLRATDVGRRRHAGGGILQPSESISSTRRRSSAVGGNSSNFECGNGAGLVADNGGSVDMVRGESHELRKGDEVVGEVGGVRGNGGQVTDEVSGTDTTPRNPEVQHHGVSDDAQQTKENYVQSVELVGESAFVGQSGPSFLPPGVVIEGQVAATGTGQDDAGSGAMPSKPVVIAKYKKKKPSTWKKVVRDRRNYASANLGASKRLLESEETVQGEVFSKRLKTISAVQDTNELSSVAAETQPYGSQ